jgi:hypothetical protein
MSRGDKTPTKEMARDGFIKEATKGGRGWVLRSSAILQGNKMM